jgi:hypothetical protein
MSCPSCSENSSTTYSRCNPPVSTNCVFYQGKDLTCPHDESFAICKGQKMSAVQEEIFNRICQLIGDTDVTEVNIPCTLEVAWNDQDKTILNLFNYVLQVQCAQKEQIAGLGTDALTVNSFITINKPCDCGCNCTTTVTLTQAFNDIITCLCNAKAEIKDLQNNLEILNQDFTTYKNMLQPKLDTLDSILLNQTSIALRLSEIESKTTCLPTCNP